MKEMRSDCCGAKVEEVRPAMDTEYLKRYKFYRCKKCGCFPCELKLKKED